jgi:hypothetical protein
VQQQNDIKPSLNLEKHNNYQDNLAALFQAKRSIQATSKAFVCNWIS